VALRMVAPGSQVEVEQGQQGGKRAVAITAQ